MKTIDQTLRFLFQLVVKAQKPEQTDPVIAESEIKPEPKPKAHSCTDDESPPGYKIRWHH